MTRHVASMSTHVHVSTGAKKKKEKAFKGSTVPLRALTLGCPPDIHTATHHQRDQDKHH